MLNDKKQYRITHNMCHKLNIVILCQSQFGYHLETYYYCKYLRDTCNIGYVCWDYDRQLLNISDVNVEYVTRAGNIFIRNARYIKNVVNYLRCNNVDICFIKYFRGCSILRILFPNLKFVFDIRTASVSYNKTDRFFYDNLMLFEALFFKNITVISMSLAKKLRLAKKAKILPLGSVPISSEEKEFNGLNLIYVGTLSGRKIDETIIGFAQFLKECSLTCSISYTIIGTGHNDEEDSLRKLVKEQGVEDKVKVVGYVPFTKLKSYFDAANIGVSFVPLTPYFDVQPVTKTFDYLLSGLPVIATATSENKLVIDDYNGVLIDDTVDGFVEGVKTLMKNIDKFDSNRIRSKSERFHRRVIVDNLESYFMEIRDSL